LRLRRVYTLREGKRHTLESWEGVHIRRQGRRHTLESWEGVNTEIWEWRYA
jgi:hypothetical protein